ncbi:hypothetical protein F0U62_39735 [Cystobacter fuscus]|uniref:hypothetical protein n=1 Tax=Cystobacter fuscus TaxID=43 RepID=UPI002B2E053F|nr:hypothetical protein F0U62_39735 [Cystobacter fuscus]
MIFDDTQCLAAPRHPADQAGGKGMLQSKKTGVVNFSGNAITLDGFNIQFKGSKTKKKSRR